MQPNSQHAVKSSSIASTITNNFLGDASCVASSIARAVVLALLLVAGVCVGTTAVAQEEPAFRHVYVPIEDLDVLFSNKRGVLLSKTEFLELWKKAYPSGKPANEGNLPPMLLSGDYRGEIRDRSLWMVGDLRIEKKSPGWETIPLTFSGVSLESATIAGKPASVGLGTNGAPLLFLSEIGTFYITVQLRAPLGEGQEAKLANFELPPAPGNLVLTLPAEYEARVDGAKVLLREDQQNKPVIPLGGRARMSLVLSRKSAIGEKKSLVLAKTQTSIKINPAQANWAEQVNVEVFAKPLSKLSFALPAGLQVVEVKCQGLARWEQIQAQDGARIELRFQNEWTGSRQISLKGNGAPQLGAEWKTPHTRLVDATAQTGILEVDFDEALTVETKSLVDAHRISAPNLAQKALRFAGWSSDYNVSVIARPKQPKLAASVANLVAVQRNQLDLNASVTVDSRHSSLFDVILLLPEGWTISSTEWNGQRLITDPIRRPGKTGIRYTFPTPIPPNQPVTLILHAEQTPDGWLREPGVTASIGFPTVQVEGASEVEGVLLVSSPAEIPVSSANLLGLESIPSAGIPGAEKNVRMAFGYRSEKPSGTLEAVVRKAEVVAESAIAARMNETHLLADYQVEFQFRGGSASEVRFELPGVTANEVQVRWLAGAAKIASQTVEDRPNNQRRWVLKLDRDTKEPLSIWVHAEVPHAGKKEIGLPLLTIVEATRQSGTVAVEGSFDQQVNVTTKELRPIDAGELLGTPGTLSNSRLIRAYQFRAVPYLLTMSIAKHQESPVLTSVCRKAEMRSVMVSAGTLRHQVTYSLENVGLQSLGVELPADSEMLGALIDGQPIEIRKQGTQYLISLPPSGGRPANVTVSIHYQTGLSQELGLAGALKQTPPKLNVPVVEITWSLYLPNEMVVVRSDGAISPVTPLTRRSLTGSVRRALASGGGGRVFNPLELLGIFHDTFFGASASETFSNVSIQISENAKLDSKFKTDQSYFAAPAANADPGTLHPIPGVSATDRPASRMGRTENKRVQRPDNAAERELQLPTSPSRDGARRAFDEPKGEPKLVQTESQYAWDNRPRDEVESEVKKFGQLGFAEGKKRAGLLSLQLSLEPSGFEYQFQGLYGEGLLDLKIQNNGVSNVCVGFIATTLMLIGWLSRNRSRRLRAVCIALLLAISLGLSGLAPLGLLFVLDGLFLGALGVWMLYIFRALLSTLQHRDVRKLAVAASMLLFLAISQSAQAQKTEKPAGVRKGDLPTIYLPYQTKQDPLKSNQVYLPQEEYDRLWNLANPGNVKSTNVTAPSVVSSVEFVGRLDGKTARFQATAVVWSFVDEVIQVPLPAYGIVVSKAMLDGSPATVAPMTLPGWQNVKHVDATRIPQVLGIFVQGRGHHKLQLEFELPADRMGATGSVSLSLLPVSTSSLALTLPETNLDVVTENISGGWDLNGAEFHAAVSGGGKVTIRWQPKTARRSADLAIDVQQRAKIEVGVTGVRYLADFDYRILQGATSALEFTLPPQALVRAASGDHLTDWSIQADAQSRKLVLRLDQPATEFLSVRLDLFYPHSAAQQTAARRFVVPQVAPVGVRRETGELVLAGDPLLDVQASDTTGLQQVGRSSVDAPKTENSASVVLAAFRYSSRPFQLTLAVAEPARKITSQLSAKINIEKERVRMRDHITISSTQNLIATRVRLPVDFNLESVETAEEIRWTSFADPKGTILEFERTGEPETSATAPKPMAVVIEGWMARDAKNNLIVIPKPVVENTVAERGEWLIFLSSGFDAETDKISGLFPLDPTQFSSVTQGTAGSSQRRQLLPSLAFRQESKDAELAVRVRKLDPRSRADSVAVVSVRETSVAYIAKLHWNIQQAGLRTLRFRTSSWIGQEAEVTGPGVRQVESKASPAGREFIVNLDREIMGDYWLQLVYTIPLPEDAIVKAPRIQIHDAENPREYVLLENNSPDQLDRQEATGLKVEPVERDAVPIPLANALKQRAIEVLRIDSPETAVSWKLRSSEKVEELSASVNLADILMVVERSGKYLAQVNYRVRNRQEQFLTLAFPSDASLWSVYVADQPSQPAKAKQGGKDVILIPLPKKAAGDFAIMVDVVYRGRIDIQKDWLERWSFPSPTVIGMTVAKTQLSLYLPKDFNYGMFRGNMEESESAFIELNRQSTEIEEALGLVSWANYGKGSAKERAFSNLSNLRYIRPGGANFKTEKARELNDKVVSEDQRLNDAITQLKQQRESQQVDQQKILTDQYFTPTDSLVEPPSDQILDAKDKTRSAKPNQNTAGAGDQASAHKADPQAIRNRLKEQVWSQTESLNRNQLNELAKNEKAQQPSQNSLRSRDRRSNVRRIDELEKRKAGEEDRSIEKDLGATKKTGGLNERKQGSDESAAEAFGVAEPQRRGGLSLRIDLPLIGEPLYFVKGRGDPEISVAVYPVAANNWLTGSIWLFVSLALAGIFATYLSRSANWEFFSRHWRPVVMLIGLVWWLVLPASGIGFGLFAIGAVFTFWYRASARLQLSRS